MTNDFGPQPMTSFAERRTVMVDTQVRPSDVTKYPIIAAMLTVPRESFVPSERRESAYVGDHVPLGGGRVLLDARSFAKMLEVLDIGPREMVLNIGAGMGYGAAVAGHLAEAVIALECDAAMAAEAETALADTGADNVAVITGPLQDGAAKHGPYDAILIEGGVETLPDAIAGQLKEGGRIAAIFMDGNLGICRAGIMHDGRINWRMAFNATAPLLPGFERARSFAL